MFLFFLVFVFRREIWCLAGAASNIVVNNLIESVLPLVICYISLIVFTQSLSIPLLSRYVVLLVSYASGMCQSFGYDFMYAMLFTINGNVSLNRLQVRKSFVKYKNIESNDCFFFILTDVFDANRSGRSSTRC